MYMCIKNHKLPHVFAHLVSPFTPEVALGGMTTSGLAIASKNMNGKITLESQAMYTNTIINIHTYIYVNL